MTLFSDAAGFPGPHHHVGAPQIISFYKDNPILIDTGVCNYDRNELYFYLHEMKAHNVVYCDEFSTDIYELSVTPVIESVDLEKGTMAIKTTVEHKDGRSYVWTRNIEVSENKIIIEDEAVSDTELPWKSRFFLKQNDVLFPGAITAFQGGFKRFNVKRDKNIMQLMKEDFIMTLTSEKNIHQVLAPVMDENNKFDYAVVAESEGFGKVFKNKTVFEFEAK